METKTVRVLPADVYDALELSALEFGGIGCGSRVYGAFPYCVIGHAGFLDGLNPEGKDDNYEAHTPVLSALRQSFGDSGIGVALKNDNAIEEDEGRISFDEWCKRLNVVRGDQ